MKPNGKYFVVRGLLLALCAVALLSIPGSAATLYGSFKLPVEAHWGKVLLTPGKYEFTLNSIVAEEDARIRAVEELRRDIVTRLTLFLQHRAAEGGPRPGTP